jgi:ATP-dependent RNA helicase RhlE
MNLFTELQLDSCLHKNLAHNLFTKLTPVQAQSIPPAMTGVDVVATAQTGTGKTLAFLLPIMQRLITEAATAPALTEELPAARPNGHAKHHKKSSIAVRSLILAPTRELALQIAESFGKMSVDTGLRCAVVVGGLSEQTQLSALRRGVQMVIATPGRLEDFLDRRLIDLSKVSTLVLDEADRMLDMGFLPAIEKILALLPHDRQSLFFSATMEQSVERLIKRNSKNPVRIEIKNAAGRTPDQVDLHVYETENDMKVHLLRHLLSQEEGSFLVFARTKHGTDRLTKRLAMYGVKAVAMHGDRTQNQRNQALAGFREGRYRVLVATDVAARGIHVDSVAHVVNFDLPQAPQDFIHRVGRTGRAGQRGSASTFFLRGERGEIKRIERECKVLLIRKDVNPNTLQELSQSPVDERAAAAHAAVSAPAAHHNSRGNGFNKGGGSGKPSWKQNGAKGPFRGKPSGGKARPSAHAFGD